jgi:hypothetical protein
MNSEDKIRMIFAAPLGVIAGIVASLIVDLFVIGYGRVAMIILGAIVLFVLFEKFSDGLSLRAMEKLSDRSEEELANIRKKRLHGSHSKKPRYVFLASALLGFLATFIWPAADILALFV